MEVKHISFAYEKSREKVLKDVNFKIPKGKITTFMGANGSGKSTLFQLMTKNLKPNRGKIRYQGKDIEQIRQRDFVKIAAIVHQNNTISADLTVEKLVSYGRTPHISMFGTMRKEDYEIVEWAMEMMGIADYRNRSVTALSGGQRQRVWIAMALAQKTELLFLDEPTTYLDIRYQIELLNQIESLNKKLGITVVMVLHDINHAIYYSDYVVGLKKGQVAFSGDPNEVITKENIKSLYGIELDIIETQGKRIVCMI